MLVDNNSITIRRIPLNFPDLPDPVIVDGRPEESFLCIGLSLLLPHLEPYLIRTMAEARKLIQKPQLTADIDAFNGQESQHYRMHIQFNKSLNLNPYKELKRHEDKLKTDYRGFTETRSLQFNLAYAEGFEAFTMAITRFIFQIDFLDRVHPAAGELFRWHMVEELEHRTVAFDVYQHVSGNYFYRLGVGLFAQWHLCQFVFGVVTLMKSADPEGFQAKYGRKWRFFKRNGRLIGLTLRHLLPKIVHTYMPWYTPHKIKMPAYAQALADNYTELARAAKKKTEVDL